LLFLFLLFLLGRIVLSVNTHRSAESDFRSVVTLQAGGHSVISCRRTSTASRPRRGLGHRGQAKSLAKAKTYYHPTIVVVTEPEENEW